ncbi:hypothetical protein TL16_g10072 [Triparma laevis f. inornata]|uniref:Uncharacterized protein n=2 Tax=Triparma laevis TaxID=1534972 RepID=A0A9W7AZ85_9STRA|nr:hypothetical protein TrLO_g9106 [Triparma laevis f. longispina]GMH84931.1 hypothetical protein TL16_g10072 [Triparma laevis f. inornata]
MPKSVASESIEGHKRRKMSRKRVAEDEGNEDGEGILKASSAANSTTLTVVSTVPTTDQFMFTNNFKGLLVGFVQKDTLITLRLATKAWKRVVDALIDKGVRSGELIVHGGND